MVLSRRSCQAGRAGQISPASRLDATGQQLSSEHRLRKPLRLLGCGRGHEHDQLVATSRLEQLDTLLRLGWRLHGSGPDPGPPCAVVGQDVLLRLRRDVVTKREVRKHPVLWASIAAGLLPCGVDALHHAAERRRVAAAHRVSDAGPGDATNSVLRLATEHDGHRVPVDRARGDYLSRLWDRLTAPCSVHQIERRIEALASIIEAVTGDAEVVRTSASPYA